MEDFFIRHFLGTTVKNYGEEVDNVKIGYIANNKTDLPLLSPVAFWRKSDPSGLRGIRIVSYFPPRVDAVIDYRQTTFEKTIIEIEDKNFLKDHKHKTIKKFDYREINVINEYTTKKGSISFEIEDSEIEEFAININRLQKMFPVKLLYGYKNENMDKNEILTPFVCFFDLPYVIPIYTKKKIDGLGVCVGAYYKEKSKEFGSLAAPFKLYFVLSNYTENIINIDGAKINSVRHVDNQYFEAYINKVNSVNQKIIKNKSKHKDAGGEICAESLEY